jgi:hypothetical protein
LKLAGVGRARLGRWSLAVIAATLAVIFGLGQLILPPIATSRLRASLSDRGVDVRVSLSAVPAVELLFGYADAVRVRIARLSSGPGSRDNLLSSIAKVGTLDARVGELDLAGLVLTDVSLTKRGNRLTARAHVTRAAIEAVLPVDLNVAPSRTGSPGIKVDATVRAFGHHISADADVVAVGGAIEIQPLIPILGDVSALNVVVFRYRPVWVDRVAAVSRGGSYVLTVTGHYR